MHAIETHTFNEKASKKEISRYCDEIAIAEGDYSSPLEPPIRFVDKVLNNRDEAAKWIEEHDKGFYDSIAIKYKEGDKTYWLVKIEYHC